MSSIFRSVPLLLSLLIGLTAGCASVQTRSEDPGTTVTSTDFRDPSEPIESVLQKMVPGLVVTRSGDGSIALQIRGSSSFRGGDSPPLYVLNGLPFQPGPEGALTAIDPYEIESIKVLKGADAAIYGIDGANGAIVITTKKAGRPRR